MNSPSLLKHSTDRQTGKPTDRQGDRLRQDYTDKRWTTLSTVAASLPPPIFFSLLFLRLLRFPLSLLSQNFAHARCMLSRVLLSCYPFCIPRRLSSFALSFSPSLTFLSSISLFFSCSFSLFLSLSFSQHMFTNTRTQSRVIRSLTHIRVHTHTRDTRTEISFFFYFSTFLFFRRRCSSFSPF